MPVDRNPSIIFTDGPVSQRQLAEARFLTDTNGIVQQRNMTDVEAMEEASRLDPSGAGAHESDAELAGTGLHWHDREARAGQDRTGRGDRSNRSPLGV